MNVYLDDIALVLAIVGLYISLFLGFIPLWRLKKNLENNLTPQNEDEEITEEEIKKITGKPIKVILHRILLGLIITCTSMALHIVALILDFFQV